MALIIAFKYRGINIVVPRMPFKLKDAKNSKNRKYTLKPEDLRSAQTILNITVDILKESQRKIDLLIPVKKRSSENAAFEIGYLMYTIQEKFRRMVDKYNTSHYMRRRLYLMELVLYLGEIENHYWEVDHLTKMLHEVERKYNVATDLDGDYREAVPTTERSGTIPRQYVSFQTRTKKKKRPKFKMDKYLQSRYVSTRKPNTRWWWPLEYGWEIDYYW